MMRSDELVDNLFRGKKAERVGLIDSPWQDTIAAWVEQGYPTRMVCKEVGERCWRREDGRDEEVKVAGEYEEPLLAWKHFGCDMVRVGGFDVMPRRGQSELLEETDEWEVRRNGAGAALKYWKYKSGTPEHIDFLMTSRQVWERDYHPHLLELDPERIKVKETKKGLEETAKTGVWTYFGNVFVWELMRQSMGDLIMYESLILDPRLWID